MRWMLPIVALALAGCTSPTRLNPGAQVPVYLGTHADVRAAWSDGNPPVGLVACYNRETKTITVARDQNEAVTFGRLLNEVGHLADDCGGHWRALALIEGGRLRTLCADMPADAKAMVAAMREYERASK